MDFSPIIIGTMRWGIWGANHSKKEVQNLIQSSLEQKLSTFDHADIYGNYTTEKLFGNAFSEMNLKREEVQLIPNVELKCRAKTEIFRRNHIIIRRNIF